MSADLTEAFRREAGGLLGFFIKRGVPAEDAADLVSDTFLAAWQSSRTSTVEPDLLRAWLFGIARKTMSRYRRGRGRRSALSDRLRTTLAAELDTRQASAADDHELEHVRSLIARLPEIDQEIVRLVYWDGFTQEEVATVLGRPAPAIRARLSRARKVLRDQLAETGDIE
ncbi:RNA polymerase sigma factor [Homoserinibacter sp. YIM 151385]|uniref:RNA polymerase sigma factor n=1 Tax=Homoserinibacter sp. YIM 151385 TaxID=2985506 RepID=UPI0022F0F8BB|nr:RNA polymerase sigma factor [Homoserinibacter sp. YIM 151385]WBU37072.1 RNA polymerase sigma factor [Homoserinibacter sp. YIM 151385]